MNSAVFTATFNVLTLLSDTVTDFENGRMKVFFFFFFLINSLALSKCFTCSYRNLFQNDINASLKKKKKKKLQM